MICCWWRNFTSVLKPEVWITFEISGQALQCGRMVLGRVSVVSCELGGGRSDLVTNSISDEASDSEGGLVFEVLGWGEGGFVRFLAEHVVAGALWGIDRLTVLHVEDAEEFLYVFWVREANMIVGDGDGDAGVLRDR
eukprot:Plantae.Rhodophyta-Palmaria_palmata.ctg15760.p2 GENE.Plantae.Rhodophyta-Palmaria_palmata.ctg15760~~Plantae.Rhodophyta-Palmaria_palmata.ctg15760.p2  ORF type:complete len:137 (+),score=15.03 Plantae.Rhodophyta-Palmaria_palmata.ctg15760:519-929(+)